MKITKSIFLTGDVELLFFRKHYKILIKNNNNTKLSHLNHYSTIPNIKVIKHRMCTEHTLVS